MSERERGGASDGVRLSEMRSKNLLQSASDEKKM